MLQHFFYSHHAITDGSNTYRQLALVGGPGKSQRHAARCKDSIRTAAGFAHGNGMVSTQAFHQHQKFIASWARQHRMLQTQCLQTCGYRNQQLVAHIMAPHVVEHTEVIQINEQECADTR